MTASIDPLDLTSRLIAAQSVTPQDDGCQALLGQELEALGFTVHHLISPDSADGPVHNLFATRGTTGPHFAFAGHTDVVPPGQGWTSDPFTPTVRGDLLYGRGAVDMKGAIAAFVAAISHLPPDHPGTISLIITGDEEGISTHGTLALMEWMAARKIVPNLCLVGEPTSQHRLGDMIKIGRRGSVNMWLDVEGTQGHVAYPHLADNPIRALIDALHEMQSITLDDGTEWFQPSNLEITDLTVGNPATNVIPAKATARLNIRFNILQQGKALVDRIQSILLAHAPNASLRAQISGEAFMTPPGHFSAMIADAIHQETGVTAELSTSGGTSDARFLVNICPVVEFGLCNATMHKLDEAVVVDDLYKLQGIYRRIIQSALGA